MSTERGRYSKVSRRIWNDDAFRKLSQPKPCGAWLWFRLLTGTELTNIPGLFQAWEAGLAQSLRWSLKDFRKAFGEVAGQGLARADWETGLVWLPNAIRHNEPESPNVILSWRSAWEELPECPLKEHARMQLADWAEARGQAWAEAFAKVTGDPYPKPSGKPSLQPSPNQEQEQEQEQKPERARAYAGGTHDSDDEWPCPVDLALPDVAKQELAARLGCSIADIDAVTAEFVGYWTIGAGSGRRRRRWLGKLRERLRDLSQQGKLGGTSARGTPDSVVTP